jgi:hypothetical protein
MNTEIINKIKAEKTENSPPSTGGDEGEGDTATQPSPALPQERFSPAFLPERGRRAS